MFLTDKEKKILFDNKLVYICSPLSAITQKTTIKNMNKARDYMYYVIKNMRMQAIAPHAYLPMILQNDISQEQEAGMKIGQIIMDKADVIMVCGNLLTFGMESEISRAIEQKQPVVAFTEYMYDKIKRLRHEMTNGKNDTEIYFCETHPFMAGKE